MMRVLYEPDVAEQLMQLPTRILLRIEKVIVRLEQWPNVSGAKPLRGRLAGHYRIRAGDYRVQFHVEEDAVVIEQVGHRDGFYEA